MKSLRGYMESSCLKAILDRLSSTGPVIERYWTAIPGAKQWLNSHLKNTTPWEGAALFFLGSILYKV